MTDLICPFSAPLVKQDFACQHAQEIIRRGGAEIACQSEAAYRQCAHTYDAMRAHALTAMDYEDNLLSVPHNVLVKIQYGGLLALNSIINNDHQATQIKDIHELISQVAQQYVNMQILPFEQITSVIRQFKTQRRGKRV